MKKSESIKEIAMALMKFQGEIENPKNVATNPYYNSKYAPLSEVLNVVRPILSKCGLSIVQAPSTVDGNIIITTILMHESGEWMEPEPLALKMDKVTAQGAGSSITYARRYALSSILGIASEDDDDGNHAEVASKSTEKIDDPKQPIVDNSLASGAQITYINNLMKKKNYGEDSMNKYIKVQYNKDDLKALTKANAGELINMLNELKDDDLPF